MDNVENAIEEISNVIEQVQQEVTEIAGVPSEEVPDLHELSTEEIDEILNEAANELGVEIPDVVESEHNIPTNSPTILLDETHSRFSAAEWANKIQEQRVILGGAGGIGRFGNLN